MAAGFTRQHLKKTVRRSPRDGRTYLYPQLIGSAAAARRRAIRAQLDIAIRYFESQVGQRRAAFDAEALIGLFEDPRLARGLIAAFARYYRFRRLDFAEVVPAAVAERLLEARLGSSAALRMNLFRYLNTAPRPGFATEDGRPDDLAAFAADLDLAPGDATELLWLDAESNWMLTRLTTPQPADLIAVYDFLTVETFLRYASRLTLEFHAPTPPSVERDVRLLLGHYDLACATAPPSPGTGWRLTVHGQADARGSWARHGKRLAHLLVRILAAHPGCLESGEAQIELADPAPVLRLDGPALAALGDRKADPAPTDLPVLTPGACADLRGALPAGWGLHLDPDPLVAPAGVLVPPAVAVRRDRRVYLVPVGDAADLGRLAGLRAAFAGRAELLPLLPPGLAADPSGWIGPTAARLPEGALDGAAVAAALEAFAPLTAPAAVEEAAPLAMLLARVRRDGVVAVPEVEEMLGALPLPGLLPAGRGVESIPDVGLCSAGFLARVREVVDGQLEYFAGRLVTLPQLSATLALNIPGADALGPARLEALIRALPDYVVMPRKLFDPYVRPVREVAGSATRAAATRKALDRAA